MRGLITAVLVIFFLIGVVWAGKSFFSLQDKTDSRDISDLDAYHMTLGSPTFENKEQIPRDATCTGANILPTLTIRETPDITGSLAFVMEDISTKPPSTHWLLWNVPPSQTTISDEVMPREATMGTNSLGNQRYDGPCPPSGKHTYVFTVYALKNDIDLAAGSSREQFDTAIQDTIITRAQLSGIYSN